MTTKVQLRRVIDGGMEDVNPMTSEECVMLEDGKKLKEVVDFVATTEDFEDEDFIVEENLVDRVESIENRIDSEFEQQNSQIATGLSNIKTVEQNISNKVDTEVAKVNAQLSEVANKGTTVEVLERVTKEEIERQISDGTITNLTIADGSITPEKLDRAYIPAKENTVFGDDVVLTDVLESSLVTIRTFGNAKVYSCGKNMQPFEVEHTNAQLTDVSVSEKYITATCPAGKQFTNINFKPILLKAGKYHLSRKIEKISGDGTGNIGFIYLRNKTTNDLLHNIPITQDSNTFTLSQDYDNLRLEYYINMNGTVTSDLTLKISELQIKKVDDGFDDSYEEYCGQMVEGQNLRLLAFKNMRIYSQNQMTINYPLDSDALQDKVEIIEEKVSSHENRIKQLELKSGLDVIDTVVCWGDSLTNGTGSTTGKPSSDINSDTSYPAVLSRLIKTDMDVINGGVGGETSWMIASRQGGMSIKIEPMTIPSNKVATRVYFKGMEQDYFYNSDAKKWTYSEDNLSYNIAVDGNALVNPCCINGVEGTLSRVKLSSGTPDPETGETVQGDVFAYYFTRSQVGNAVTFTTPKTLITNADKNYRNAINVIWMGQNDAPLHDGKYITQIGCEDRTKAMIDNLTHNKYIVMDLPSGDNIGSAERVQSFSQKFGKHYLNIREYICKYGIQVANELGAKVTPSNEDIANIQKGQIPMCFKIDGVHGNYWYYQIVARAVYEKGIDLGYWE